MNDLRSKGESASDEKEEPAEYVGNFGEGFLCESACENGRKKMYEKIDIVSDSSTEREINELEEEYYNF